MATKVRAYDANHAGNTIKLDALREILPVWRSALAYAQMLQIRTLKTGGQLGFVDTKTLPSMLSQRQWKSVFNQVNAALRSWQGLAALEFKKHIAALDLTQDEKKELYYANACKDWWNNDILRPLLPSVIKVCPFPNLGHVSTMLMDGPIATVEEPRTGAFQWWVRISRLPGRGKPVRIPLRGTPYMNSKTGKVANFCQVVVRRDGRVIVRLVKKSPATPRRTAGRSIGVDWGLKNLLTTSDGSMHGSTLYAWLSERDTEIQGLLRELQKRGIKPRDSRRYRNLISRVRGHIDSEAGRVVRSIAGDDVREIVVEALDFRFGGLSKRLNRIVSNSGRAAITKRLAALPEDLGITISEVSCSYTSQSCSGCGFTSLANRRTQAGFRCRFCGKTLHADVNAARNILARRSMPVADRYTTKGAVLEHLDGLFTSRWGLDFSRVLERQERPRSRATSSLSG